MDFGHLLVERGLITALQLEEGLAIQRRYILEGREPVPRLGEIFIDKGWLSETQVAGALAAQNKRILSCTTCNTQVNVEERSDAAAYRCGRCGGEMVAPPEVTDVRVVDTSVILVAKDPVPEEVAAAAQDPARKLGKYILLEEMGRGGWAIVHRAWDTYLNQYVALKFLKPLAKPNDPEKRNHETRIHDLLKEARSAIRLRHPHIVTVYDVGRLEKQFYIAMDCLDGKTLSQLIKEAKKRGHVSPLYEEPQKFTAILRDISRAVHYAHTRQIPVIHCDLKPSNIFIGKDGRAYVLDFGLSRELAKDQAKPASVVRGTPSYMAPEQASGHTDQIDARTDVYGIGAILYELLTGRPPFVGEMFEVLTKATSTIPIRPSAALAENPLVRSSGFKPVTVPPALERICLNCLEKSKDARYTTARELAEEFEGVLGSRDLRDRRSDTDLELQETHISHRRSESPAFRPSNREGRVLFYISGGVSCIAIILAAMAWSGGPRVRIDKVQAQLESIRKTLDTQAANFQVELAQQGFREVVAVGEGTPPQSWMEHQREGLEWIRRMKDRLIEAINNKAKYKAGIFRLKDRELPEVEVVHANATRIVVISAQETRDILWAAVEPNQLADLIKVVLGLSSPSDRLALAIYCIRTAQHKEAEELLNSLAGTDLEIPSQAYRRELPHK